MCVCFFFSILLFKFIIGACLGCILGLFELGIVGQKMVTFVVELFSYVVFLDCGSINLSSC